MAIFKMGEIVKHKGEMFVYWNSGVSDQINYAVVERTDDYEQRDLPRFQTVKLAEVEKVRDPAEARAARMRMRTARG